MTFGNELIYRVGSTGTGTRVVRYDGRGLSEGYASKRILRYFYDENHEERAHEYAREKADERDNARVVELGERL